MHVPHCRSRPCTREDLYLLGDHVDPDCLARMPEYATEQEALQAAVQEYRQNAMFNMGRAEVEDPVGGGTFLLHDEDAGWCVPGTPAWIAGTGIGPDCASDAGIGPGLKAGCTRTTG